MTSKQGDIDARIWWFVGGFAVAVLVLGSLWLFQATGAAILRLGLRVVLQVFGVGVLSVAVGLICLDRKSIFVKATLEGEPAAAIVSAISVTILLLLFPSVGVLSLSGIPAASVSQLILLVFTIVFIVMAVVFNILTFTNNKPIVFQLPGVFMLVLIGAVIIGAASVL